ncbi:GPI inositol-deacylase [Sparassis crispa]|uniref:GPI inositol-deacylase n=1 Tax=Sparassis crispa TaxID=139825 RepID=A0A401GCF8_9APHY|nr:GPI inositol-deacylase [Sparassis crispa]GBE79854.1 GPI inositol-deacylase [Sparassis crispa]
MTRLLVSIGLFSVLSTALLYLAGVDIVQTLSPQGCRMSWMSPSYVLQSAFDLQWSPLAKRYSLWLYREVGWEPNELHGSPVLFIPGNAGSSHQVRSIASSATRQFYTSPYQLSSEFSSSLYKPLDFFTLEFNEDLSAFHGPTLDAEKNYASAAVAYILTLYPSNTTITVLGHSMGGIVASALLPHPNISAIITMSTPHTLPPARFDRRVDTIYAENQVRLADDPTPILSLCGGATDLMVPSESCILPSEGELVYRRSVFTSALEGSWTGVGHREMVWCHQVRWRVARAALELQVASTPSERGAVLDTWIRDGHRLSPAISLGSDILDLNIEPAHEVVAAGQRLLVRDPRGSRMYFLPMPARTSKFVLYVSRGSILSISPRAAIPLSVSVFLCGGEATCTPLHPTSLKLVPSPVPGLPFPVPREGADESEGVVVFEADAVVGEAVAVKVENGDGRGWVVGEFIPANIVTSEVGMFGILFSTVSISLPEDTLYSQISFPILLSSSLIVYQLTPVSVPEKSCKDVLLSPILQHTSHPSETHYYPLHPSARPILLHSHASGPFISRPARGFTLTIFSSGENACNINRLKIRFSWWGTLGRWGVRYGTAAASWSVGVVALVIFHAWSLTDASGRTPSVSLALSHFAHQRLPQLLFLSLAISFLPLPSGFWLGNVGELFLVPLAPLLLLIVTGLVCLTWGMLTVLVSLFNKVTSVFRKPREDTGSRTNALLSMALVCLLIFILVPWQVAFLGCYVYHFYTCVARLPRTPDASPASPSTPVTADMTPVGNGAPPTRLVAELSVQSQHEYLLLLMTWLLPLAAPILAVWVRTLATAGIMARWDADHNVFCVAPFLVAVEFASVGGSLFQRPFSGIYAFSPRWGMLVLAAVAFLVGPRSTYLVFEVASVVVGIPVLLRLASWDLLGRSQCL